MGKRSGGGFYANAQRLRDQAAAEAAQQAQAQAGVQAVSYTHLTLPTTPYV